MMGAGSASKRAVTVWFWLTMTVQLLPTHVAPVMPKKLAPAAALAVSVTVLPGANCALQAPLAVPALIEQLMPAADTVPFPVPVPDTVSVTGARANEAVTSRSWFISTVHTPTPVQLPLQPLKTNPAAGVAL